MSENRENENWDEVERCLASEIINGRERVSKAKNFSIVCLTVAVILVAVGLSLINYKNDSDWRELFFAYEDGQGKVEHYNYYAPDAQYDEHD